MQFTKGISLVASPITSQHSRRILASIRKSSYNKYNIKQSIDKSCFTASVLLLI